MPQTHPKNFHLPLHSRSVFSRIGVVPAHQNFGEPDDEGRQNTFKQGSLIFKTVVDRMCLSICVCKTIHRAFHVNTGVCVCVGGGFTKLNHMAGALFCGCLKQNLWTFWQCHNWPQPWPKQTHAKSRSKFFGVTRAVPHATRTAVSLASVTTSVTTILPKCT